ncbi:hypothetical protein LLG95_04080 [bacterium]|nr:hypothetical protein [bacterium]
MTRKTKRGLWWGFLALTWLGYIWPLVGIGNRVEPFILGMPFLVFWYIALVVVQFVAMLIMYSTLDKD